MYGASSKEIWNLQFSIIDSSCSFVKDLPRLLATFLKFLICKYLVNFAKIINVNFFLNWYFEMHQTYLINKS